LFLPFFFYHLTKFLHDPPHQIIPEHYRRPPRRPFSFFSLSSLSSTCFPSPHLNLSTELWGRVPFWSFSPPPMETRTPTKTCWHFRCFLRASGSLFLLASLPFFRDLPPSAAEAGIRTLGKKGSSPRGPTAFALCLQLLPPSPTDLVSSVRGLQIDGPRRTCRVSTMASSVSSPTYADYPQPGGLSVRRPPNPHSPSASPGRFCHPLRFFTLCDFTLIPAERQWTSTKSIDHRQDIHRQAFPN